MVTGANGGLGEQFVLQALERGASKVYAAARKPRDWSDARVEPLSLDIIDADAVAQAAVAAPDVDLLINNAAIAPTGDTLFGPEDEAHRIFETNFFGTLRVANAFAPILAANGGGTLVNILSSSVWVSLPTVYAASKAAAWSATNGLRFALEAQGTHVMGLLVGMIDTPMAAHFDVPKTSPAIVVAQAYDGIASGALEVLADEQTRDLKSRLSGRAEDFYPWLHGALRAFLGQ
ncbi:SDR family oxidoreductase [Sphingomonas abietis]|uniref:SDR family oxidoreductase n=1 Tax=Sphingomonas abietis TaxID=3012344 RepID=A0ABY7NT81_9SPHN|nr:SDR family oxidoreductase [Sphingomonas abietis]WBO24347.1 SDR family oxidoreductase [Sphingomonas abietis]